METEIYEYKTVKILDKVVDKLNEMANDGWELVAVVEEIHYFKRKKEKQQLLD